MPDVQRQLLLLLLPQFQDNYKSAADVLTWKILNEHTYGAGRTDTLSLNHKDM